MKLLVVFVAVLSLALGMPTVSQWTLHELSEALQNPNTDPAHIPYLEAALNELLMSIHAGNDPGVVSVVLPTPASPAPVAPEFPSSVTSEWTLNELSSALQDPSTDPAHVPYLEAALNEMMNAIMSGHNMDVISVTLPVTPDVVIPTPVLPEAPVDPAPVLPPTAVAPPAVSAPLIQIIVNIRQQEADNSILPAPVQLPDLIDVGETPDSVNIIDQAPDLVNIVDQAPDLVNIVDQAPDTVTVVDSVPVVVVDNPGNPIDVIAVAPPENPIDNMPLPVSPQ